MSGTMSSDQIVRCLLDESSVRVVAVTTTKAVNEIARRHHASGLAAVALGRAATAGLLLATLTKDEEQVTLQIMGNGPIGSVTVDARSSGRVRAYVKHPAAEVTSEEPTGGGSRRVRLSPGIGSNGLVNVVRDMGMSSNFTGQIDLQTGEIDEDVEHYLIKSEQIDSVLCCDTLLDAEGKVELSAGLLIQTLPQAGGTALLEFIRQNLRATTLAASLMAEAKETSDIDPESLARRALGPCAESLHRLDARPVVFHCPCTQERAAATLRLLHDEDLKAMIQDDTHADVTCSFCGQAYRFSEIEIERIRRRRESAKA